ncbi:tol-pal system protein YbgF [Glycocaulis abyssi]|uniref:tol-pal system protein YbgF n=1 Tax=Glycocaulis abyssi TaxID=1433403 RepID=UPI00352A5E96
MRWLVSLLIGFGLLAGTAHAQSSRALTMRMDAIEARLNEMEQQSLAGDPVAESLLMRVEALEREQRSLTGELETLTFENRRLRQEVDRLNTAMRRLLSGEDGELAVTDPDNPHADARAAATRPLSLQGSNLPATRADAEAAAASSGAAESSSREAASAPSDPDEAFARARSRLLDGDFAGAQERFASFVEVYSAHPMTGQAWYWLGETHFAQGDYQDAADAYMSSLRADRRGERGPDALVRLGASLAAMDQRAAACNVLGSFSQEYPNAGADARQRAERERSRAGCR